MQPASRSNGFQTPMPGMDAMNTEDANGMEILRLIAQYNLLKKNCDDSPSNKAALQRVCDQLIALDKKINRRKIQQQQEDVSIDKVTNTMKGVILDDKGKK